MNIFSKLLYNSTNRIRYFIKQSFTIAFSVTFVVVGIYLKKYFPLFADLIDHLIVLEPHIALAILYHFFRQERLRLAGLNKIYIYPTVNNAAHIGQVEKIINKSLAQLNSVKTLNNFSFILMPANSFITLNAAKDFLRINHRNIETILFVNTDLKIKSGKPRLIIEDGAFLFKNIPINPVLHGTRINLSCELEDIDINGGIKYISLDRLKKENSLLNLQDIALYFAGFYGLLRENEKAALGILKEMFNTATDKSPGHQDFSPPVFLENIAAKKFRTLIAGVYKKIAAGYTANGNAEGALTIFDNALAILGNTYASYPLLEQATNLCCILKNPLYARAYLNRMGKVTGKKTDLNLMYEGFLAILENNLDELVNRYMLLKPTPDFHSAKDMISLLESFVPQNESQAVMIDYSLGLLQTYYDDETKGIIKLYLLMNKIQTQPNYYRIKNRISAILSPANLSRIIRLKKGNDFSA